MIQKSKLIILFFFLIIISGSSGFYLLEDNWSIFDSIYMTVITLSTVGFGEVQPLSQGGKIWAMIVIIFGVSGFAMVVSRLNTSIIEFKDYKVKNMLKKIKKMKDHYILCGFGRMGAVIARELHEKNIPFVVVDLNEEKIKKVNDLGYLYIHADATFDTTLREAGIMNSKGIAITLDTDQDNLFVTMSAKNLNSDSYILSRCSQKETGRKLKRAGAGKIVNPYIAGGHRMSELLVAPFLEDAVSIHTEESNIDFALEEIKIENFMSLNKIKIKHTNLREKYSLIIVGIIDEEGNKIINPDPDFRILKEHKIILIGQSNQFTIFFKDNNVA
jgi:voltage-gated potassium channel